MDGIHDLGGMHGFGAVERDDDEPVFHHRWEATVRAMQAAVRGRGLINLDEFRHAVERMDPAHYLSSSYYEHWLDGITRSLLEKNIVDEAELEKRTAFFLERPDAEATDAVSQPLPETAPIIVNRQPHSVVREQKAPFRFSPGDKVRTLNVHPTGHTRLPRYARGKTGVIHHIHGVHIFPDTNAHNLGENPKPVYNVEFAATELWGPDAEPNERVNIDLWESYLEPA